MRNRPMYFIAAKPGELHDRNRPGECHSQAPIFELFYSEEAARTAAKQKTAETSLPWGVGKWISVFSVPVVENPAAGYFDGSIVPTDGGDS